MDPLALAVGVGLGLVLGLLGGGGGLIAVPVLMTAFALSFDVASTASLVIIGLGSLVALVPHHRARRVDWRTGLLFGAVGTVSAVLAARLALWLDDRIQQYGFALLLVAAGSVMLRNAIRAHRRRHVPESTTAQGARIHAARLVPLASGVGVTTGLFGVGGGFITVPALVATVSMPVKRATATALVVIVINASAALAARYEALPPAGLVLSLVGGTAIGAVVGALWSRRLPSWLLSGAFGVLTLVIAAWTLVHA